MDTEKPLNPELELFQSQVLDAIQNNNTNATDNSIIVKEPEVSVLDIILKQRHLQRSVLFWVCIAVVIITILFLFALIITQVYYRYTNIGNKSLFNGYELEILTTGILASIVGIIHIITTSLWDDRPYMSSLEKDHDKHHHSTE